MKRDDGNGLFFNRNPTISAVQLRGGCDVAVADDVLLDPDGLVDWARNRAFRPPGNFPYPGVIVGAPAGLSARFVDFFAHSCRPAEP